jgi:hypothetical protein
LEPNDAKIQNDRGHDNDKTPPKTTVKPMTYAGDEASSSWIMGLELSSVSRNTSCSGIEYMQIDSKSAVMAAPHHTASEYGTFS